MKRFTRRFFKTKKILHPIRSHPTQLEPKTINRRMFLKIGVAVTTLTALEGCVSPLRELRKWEKRNEITNHRPDTDALINGLLSDPNW